MLGSRILLLATAGLKPSSVSEVSGFTAALGRFRDQELKSLTELLGRVAAVTSLSPYRSVRYHKRPRTL